jgi:peptidyl-prolyl cis-trans isomerase SurA
MLGQGYYGQGVDLKCEILEDMLFQKLLLYQARRDSIVVTPKEIETELNRRLGVFINQVGSEKKLEEFYGKSIVEIKDEFREIIREQLLTQRMQAKLTEEVKITPSDVKTFYNSLPKDSIPIIEASFELSQILKEPVISNEEIQACKDKLNNIRERVLNGEKFSTMAILYSQDPGSSGKGGELGFVTRNDLVPEFAAVAFSLPNPNDVSNIVKTDFGYHIIQLIERKGEMINIRHILIIPETDPNSVDSLTNLLTNVREEILTGSISFEEAVLKYSDDEDTRMNGGKMMNPYSGNARFTPDIIDIPTNRKLGKLSAGEITEPIVTADMQGKSVIKIVRVDQKVVEHVASIEEDYQELQLYATQKEQQKLITEWIENQIDKTYIQIDESYVGCTFMYADWLKK